jgi:hypothetical protein
LLEGSVRKAGGQLRVTVQLIEATTGFHRWSQRFDRALDDVFAIQDEIAQSVAATLRGGVLSQNEKQALERPRTGAAAIRILPAGPAVPSPPYAARLAEKRPNVRACN